MPKTKFGENNREHDLTMIQDEGLVCISISGPDWVNVLPVVARGKDGRLWVEVAHTPEYVASVGRVKPSVWRPMWENGHRGHTVLLSTREAAEHMFSTPNWSPNDGFRPGYLDYKQLDARARQIGET